MIIIRKSILVHLVDGFGQTHNPGTSKVHQQMIRWSGNLARIRKSEQVSFQMVNERNYAI